MQGHVNTGEISREMPTTQVLTRKDLSYYYLTHLYIFRVVIALPHFVASS